jgi:hypothetical protein
MATDAAMLTTFRLRLLGAASKLAPFVAPHEPNLARDLIERELLGMLGELSSYDPGRECPRTPNA